MLVNVWESWCVPCREEAPDLARFNRELRGRAWLVGIDFQDAKADALGFIREFGWRFPNMADPTPLCERSRRRLPQRPDLDEAVRDAAGEVCELPSATAEADTGGSATWRRAATVGSISTLATSTSRTAARRSRSFRALSRLPQ